VKGGYGVALVRRVSGVVVDDDPTIIGDKVPLLFE
jgi:hypothetical protein